MNDDLIYRLRKRAEIRRQISTRKSVQEGAPDRIADLLEEAADCIEQSKGKHQQPKLYSERYDAYYNPITNEWLESTCSDPNCEYCVNRPMRP
jgi:hypothetical protein